LSHEDAIAADADAKIASATIDKLRAAAQEGRRFFGWVFFVSPHAFYRKHYRDWPAATPLDEYRQEVRYLDEQLGKVIRELDALNLLASTIVLYTSDHGEEFQEHGGSNHVSTVYSEVTHVPLVAWVPGLHGTSMDRPTSTMYLFPWLFEHGSAAMKDAALHRLRSDIGPMLERTGGAVVTELLAPHLMMSSLIYPDRKFNYDFNSRLHQAFRLDRDRLEQHDLYESDAELAEQARARVAGYRSVRGDRNAFTFRPDKLDPRDADTLKRASAMR
jgi:arylsulfatase A-like enzyme